MDADTKIVSLEPTSLEEIVDNILLVGKMAGAKNTAEKLATRILERIRTVKEKTRSLSQRPRVFFMEWLQPPWVGGHWVPEMIDYAGGIDRLGHSGQPSYRTEWKEVVESRPEIIILSPCGFNAEQVVSESAVLSSYTGWKEIPAFKSGRIYAVNASAYFSRPGPRIVDGLEILAHLLHPELFPENPHPEAVKTVSSQMILNRQNCSVEDQESK